MHHQHQQLSTPLLEDERGADRVLCRKYPLVYVAVVPQAALSPASSSRREGEGEREGDQQQASIHIAPSHGYPDILEVHHLDDVGIAAAAARREDDLQLLQTQDRLYQVDGRLVNSLEELCHALRQNEKDDKKTVELRFMRRKNPHAEYIDMEEKRRQQLSLMEEEESSLLTLLITGGGCISFSPSTSASSSSLSLSAAGSGSSSTDRLSSSLSETTTDLPLQPYESWGDETTLDIHGLPVYCFPLFLYEVQPDDTSLPALAKRFGLKVDDLRRDNRGIFRIGEPGVLLPGQILKVRNVGFDAVATQKLVRSRDAGRGAGISHHHHLDMAVPSSEEFRGSTITTSSSNSNKLSPHTQQTHTHTSKRPHHVVTRGETVKGLCHKYHMSELDLRRINREHFPLGEKSVLREGMRLMVFATHPPHHHPHPSSPSLHPHDAYRPSAVGALLTQTGSPIQSGSSSSSSSSSRSNSGSYDGGGGGGKAGQTHVLFPILDLDHHQGGEERRGFV